MITIEKLVKRFGRFTAVDGLDLKVPAGQVFGFLGPNGAGKTTTMKIMVGLMRPNSGRVMIDGIDVHRHPLQAKRILGFVPDQPFVYEKLTGREYLFFLGGLYRLPGKVIERRAGELLQLFGLSAWAEELIEGYSHGMRQRLVMAGALLHEPKVFITDEPMVGLDPAGAELVKGLFRDFARRGGCVFLSTHTLEVAEQLCDRVGILHQGRLVAEGSLEEIRALGKAPGENLRELFFQLTSGAPGN